MKVVNQSDENCALKFWAATMRLQDVLHSLGIGKVKLLKMDVEGFELDVCKGLDFGGLFRPEKQDRREKIHRCEDGRSRCTGRR